MRKRYVIHALEQVQLQAAKHVQNILGAQFSVLLTFRRFFK
jgi:hypothetical protein